MEVLSEEWIRDFIQDYTESMYLIIQKYELIKNGDVLDESLEQINQCNYSENGMEDIQIKVDKYEDLIVKKQGDLKKFSLNSLDELPEFVLQEIVPQMEKTHKLNVSQEFSFWTDGIYGSNFWISGHKELLGNIVIDFLKGATKERQRLMHQKKWQETKVLFLKQGFFKILIDKNISVPERQFVIIRD